MRKQKNSKTYLVIVGLLLSGVLIAWRAFRGGQAKEKKATKEPNPLVTGLMITQIKSALQRSKYLKYSDWIIAMARHESGSFTSILFEKNRNAFGMGIPSKRTFLGKPSDLIVEGQPMAKYESIKQSTEDFLELLKYNNFPTNLTSVRQFAQELKNDGYYTDSVDNYTAGLERWLTPSEYKLQRANVNSRKFSSQRSRAPEFNPLPSNLYGKRKKGIKRKGDDCGFC